VGVPADSPIVVQFDRPLVPRSVIGRLTVAPSIPGCNLTAAFTADPSAGCRVVWLNGNQEFVVQHPGAILAPDTHYTFTLFGGFSDPTGAVNSVDHRWDMTTAVAPQVRGLSPIDGSTNVPVDAPLTVDFTQPMDAAATAEAIRLDPALPGTRVLRNARDPSRFIVLPGRLLTSGVTYRLTVGPTAADEHGQILAAPAVVRFTTAGLGPGGHGLVLAARQGEAASQVLITGLAPVEDGVPVSAEVALEAARCAGPNACGVAAPGSPLYSYTSARLSGDGRWLAVVERDDTVSVPASTLLVIDAATGSTRAAIPDGSLPSWSPDGTTLAFARAGAVSLYRPSSGVFSTVPGGDPLVAPPSWATSELLVLSSETAGGVQHVELADVLVQARYPLPGVTGVAAAAVVSPDGSQLAVHRDGAGVTGTWLVSLGSAAPPRGLDANLTPVGFAGPATLVAIARGGGAATGLVRVSVAGDEQIPIPQAAGSGSPASVAVSLSGRQLVFLAMDSSGQLQAYVENADGSDPLSLTAFDVNSFEAVAVSVSG
jgi:hypothetical protein